MIISLTNSDLKCEIDDSDWSLVKDYSWYLKQSGFNSYVCTSKREGNQVRTIRIHRLIMAAGDDEETHHIDFDILNNKRNNLQNLSKQKHRKIHLEN